ncbi:SRPBCC family protein [Spirillospora sp. NPDC029432]|uniref:SRPBCC family protein n=1 Tax=Spirillospora sp. NPDC029432 TaxID=3154599 RepID=UPI003451431D
MKRGNWASKLPAGQVAKRLPIGGRKKASPLSRLPIGGSKSRLPSVPGGRTAGTAGGLLLGAGAAVAAGRAVQRLNGRRAEDGADRPDEADTEARDEQRPAETGENPDGGGEEKKPGLFARIKESFGRKGGGGGAKKVKVTNIEEHIDIGASRRLVYDQWTQFQDYPAFMKKVVSVDQAADEKLNWKAKIFWSSRTWESTIVEQVPDRHIVWRSKGSKGHVDGTVSFHKIAPNLTRVLLVLEYHPQGLFERTGNLWRAQGRRVRLELKHFRRYVMTQSLLRPDEIEGWRGEIRDSEVVKTHEEAVAEEEKAAEQEKDRSQKESADA